MNESKIMQESTEQYPLEILDQFLLFQNDNNDHQIRGVIYFDGMLDQSCMAKAIMQSIRLIPVLACRLIEDKKKSYWEKIHQYDDDSQIVTFVHTDDLKKEMTEFLSVKVDEFVGPQIRARILREGKKDTLCIVLNHMAFDGAGFKDYLYLISRIYTEIKRQDLSRETEKKADRNLFRIFKQFSFFERFRVFMLRPDSTNSKFNSLHFPRELHGNFQPMFVTYRLSQNRTQKLKQYGKDNGFTINDIIIAAYYRSLYQLIQIPEGMLLKIPCMVDLRRYLPEETEALFCNLSSMIETQCEPDITFQETVKEINRQMKMKKNGYPGLHGLGILSLIQKILPYFRFKKLIKKRKYPMLSITNLGVIDAGKLIFDSVQVKDAAILTALKHSPYFQLTFSTFNNAITLSASLVGTETDRKTVNLFFDILNEELP